MDGRENHSFNFRRWAIVGAVLPTAVILIAVFIVVPLAGDSELASRLGDTLGLIFEYWLAALVLAAVIAALWHSRRVQ